MTTRRLAAVPGTALLPALVACGSSEGTDDITCTEATDPSPSRSEIEVFTPTYLPSGLDPCPIMHYVANFLEMTYWPSEEGDAIEGVTPSFITIFEDPLSGVECPLCPEEGMDEVQLTSTKALAEADGAQNEVDYTLYFPFGETYVTRTGAWEVAAGENSDPRPTEEMKQELIRVANSMASGS